MLGFDLVISTVDGQWSMGQRFDSGGAELRQDS